MYSVKKLFLLNEPTAELLKTVTESPSDFIRGLVEAEYERLQSGEVQPEPMGERRQRREQAPTLSIRVSETQDVAFKALAAARGVSESKLVRDLITEATVGRK